MKENLIRAAMLVFCLLLAMFAPLATSGEAENPQSVTFGLVPQQSASKLARLLSEPGAQVARVLAAQGASDGDEG